MKKDKARSPPAVAPASAVPPARSATGALPAPQPGELRVSVDKRAYAEIIGHAVVEPDVEVCGVLVGRLETDAHGPWVRVSAAIRGEAAREEGAAVTFTHETWNHIHGEMDRRFKDDQIVGWYHTHGGFGVFLSEMDTFVHDNFFPEKHHVAYVYDPLAGSEAFFHRTAEGLQPVRRYWVGGRERKPAMRLPEAAPAAAPGHVAGRGERLERLERAVEGLRVAADARAPGGSLVPWGIAAVAAALLMLQWRGGGVAPGAAQAEGQALVIIDRDGATGAAVGIPLEGLSHVQGPVYRDRLGNARVGLELRAPNGTPLVQPGLLTALAPPARSEAELALERQRAEAAAQERAGLLRILAWAGGLAAGLAAILGIAWYLLNRRR